ncbi:phospholipid/cholesterol/gamma-HCH transport system substrate-binding protein [Haloechinothrix alba]|uniref:Phospholipid/cholesterol/gamma-HCH transport system substrate-binding protein n=1 Tax=Haloechinothrix alba TaxID=664784 RepID=A0A238XPJ6_9PSEU|nr:MlaD family protein [Haloechinothrix alba]SNR60373.1 phospholipid/cholesterol/gamma-HCH transport system substrate-binding protein [Haloechinothrix alba]
MKTRFSLRRSWQRLRTIPGLGRNVTALASLVVLGLAALTFLLGNLSFIPPGADRYEFSADFAKASAVNVSHDPPVRIAGVEVGVVTNSEVTSDGNARLTFSLEPGHEIHANARAVLRSKNPVNEMYVNIDPGGPPAESLEQGEVIPVGQTERPVQPDEVLEHLDTRTRDAVTNLLATSDVALANAPETLPDGVNATTDAMISFKPVVAKLDERRDKISKLVTALSRISTAVGGNNERLTELANSLQRTLGTLSERDQELRKTLAELPGTTDELSRAMTSVDSLAGELDPTLESIDDVADELPNTLGRVRETLDTAGNTAEAAGPAIDQAEPLLEDLDPLVRDVHGALDHLEPVSGNLDPVTEAVVPYLNDLQAFVYNTSSVFKYADGQGGLVRGHVTVPLPDGGVIPGSQGGEPGPDAEEGGQ